MEKGAVNKVLKGRTEMSIGEMSSLQQSVSVYFVYLLRDSHAACSTNPICNLYYLMNAVMEEGCDIQAGNQWKEGLEIADRKKLRHGVSSLLFISPVVCQTLSGDIYSGEGRSVHPDLPQDAKITRAQRRDALSAATSSSSSVEIERTPPYRSFVSE